MDPRRFEDLIARELTESPLIALARRMEVVTFWLDMDDGIAAEVMEHFARQMHEQNAFEDVAEILVREACVLEPTLPRVSLLSEIVRRRDPAAAKELRAASLDLPAESVLERFASVFGLVESGEWERLSRGEQRALLERTRARAFKQGLEQ